MPSTTTCPDSNGWTFMTLPIPLSLFSESPIQGAHPLRRQFYAGPSLRLSRSASPVTEVKTPRSSLLLLLLLWWRQLGWLHAQWIPSMGALALRWWLAHRRIIGLLPAILAPAHRQHDTQKGGPHTHIYIYMRPAKRLHDRTQVMTWRNQEREFDQDLKGPQSRWMKSVCGGTLPRRVVR